MIEAFFFFLPLLSFKRSFGLNKATSLKFHCPLQPSDSRASCFEESFNLRLFLLTVPDTNENQLILYYSKNSLTISLSFHFIQMKAFCYMLLEESSNAAQTAPGEHTMQLK